MEFRDSQTYRNLRSAFERECMAGSKYVLYGNRAKADGFEQIGNIFYETAANEQAHAELWWRLMHGGDTPDTLGNLGEAAESEREEWTRTYLDYANVARAEGYEEIARRMEAVAAIEKHHNYRFQNLEQNIRRDQVFRTSKSAVWICLNCGHIERQQSAPDFCPVCGMPQGYFELNCENY